MLRCSPTVIVVTDTDLKYLDQRLAQRKSNEKNTSALSSTTSPTQSRIGHEPDQFQSDSSVYTPTSSIDYDRSQSNSPPGDLSPLPSYSPVMAGHAPLDFERHLNQLKEERKHRLKWPNQEESLDLGSSSTAKKISITKAKSMPNLFSHMIGSASEKPNYSDQHYMIDDNRIERLKLCDNTAYHHARSFLEDQRPFTIGHCPEHHSNNSVPLIPSSSGHSSAFNHCTYFDKQMNSVREQCPADVSVKSFGSDPPNGVGGIGAYRCTFQRTGDTMPGIERGPSRVSNTAARRAFESLMVGLPFIGSRRLDKSHGRAVTFHDFERSATDCMYDPIVHTTLRQATKQTNEKIGCGISQGLDCQPESRKHTGIRQKQSDNFLRCFNFFQPHTTKSTNRS